HQTLDQTRPRARTRRRTTRMLRRRRLLTAAIGLLSVGLMMSAGPASAAALPKSDLKVLGSGSDVSYLMPSALHQLYNESPGCNLVVLPPTVQPLDFQCQANTPDTIKTEDYAHDVVSQAYPLGASNGILQVCGGLSGVTFATSTRLPKS